MTSEVDADGLEGLEIKLLDVFRRGLKDDLKLGVLVEAIGILAIAAIGRTARGLHVSNTVGLGSENTKKGLRRHGSGADFNVERLLQNASLRGPEVLQLEDEFLKSKWLGCHG